MGDSRDEKDDEILWIPWGGIDPKAPFVVQETGEPLSVCPVTPVGDAGSDSKRGLRPYVRWEWLQDGTDDGWRVRFRLPSPEEFAARIAEHAALSRAT